MASEVLVYRFPRVEDPTPAEWETPRGWRVAVRAAWEQSLAGFTGGSVTCRVAEPRLADDDAAPAGGWAASFVARDGRAAWALLLSAEAVELLTAASLGLSPGAAGGAAVDRATLGVVAGDLAQRVWRATGMSGIPGVDGATTAEAVLGDMPQPLLLFEVDLVAGERVTTALVAASWARVQPPRTAPLAVAGQTVGPEALREAEVDLEAMLPGTTVGARDLLELRPGDVIPLGSVAQEVVLRVNGQAVALGRAGARGERLAVSIRQTSLTREGEAHVAR